MNKSLNTLITTFIAVAAGNAVAASSVDLTVRGMITPSACTPSLANGGVVDYGKISAKELRPTLPTSLGNQTIQMTVNCDAATLVAIAAKDNREGTESSMDYYNFGIGLTEAGEKLGYLTLRAYTVVADGTAVRLIASRDGGVTWERDSNLMDDSLTAVSDMSNLIPLPVQALTADLLVNTVIAPTNTLTLTSETPIDGAVTMTVTYL